MCGRYRLTAKERWLSDFFNPILKMWTGLPDGTLRQRMRS
jgi:hypothetical protein